MSDESTTWLPNLVGGVSIWKLASDLNEPQFFDGRLLVPDTEGSDSLPTTVRWNLTELVPLAEARSKHPAETEKAIADFGACLAKVSKTFADPSSGYHKYKEAFTVPSLEVEGTPNYFFSPTSGKLFAINWGASPRALGGQGEFVFGYGNFEKLFGASVAAAAVGTGAAVAAAAVAKAEDKPKEEEKPKDEGKKRPWWLWLLLLLGVLAIIGLILFLLRACDEQHAGMDGGVLGSGGNARSMTEAGAEAGTDASLDATTVADADAGKDAGKDAASDDDDDDDVDDDDSSSGGTSTVSSGGTTTVSSSGTTTVSSGGSHKVVTTITPGGGSKEGPHRVHIQGAAKAWRVVAGMNKVSRTEARKKKFEVWLKPGSNFEGVKVEWKDKDGKWHAH